MKLSTCCAALLLALASPVVLAAPGSCERIQSDISQRIINNGVPESSFTLSIVPNDQVDQPDSQVVGHCANDTHIPRRLLVVKMNGSLFARAPMPRWLRVLPGY
ncbi:DUF1161 domain-containing protein [Escherichia coli]